MRRVAAIIRRCLRATGGAAAVELALVLPALITAILGIWYLGWSYDCGSEIGAAVIGELQLVGKGRSLGAARRRHDVLRQPAFAGLERDRAADQADADQCDLVEHDGAHLLWAAKRASESRTAFTSASVPMVMRRCSGMP